MFRCSGPGHTLLHTVQKQKVHLHLKITQFESIWHWEILILASLQESASPMRVQCRLNTKVREAKLQVMPRVCFGLKLMFKDIFEMCLVVWAQSLDLFVPPSCFSDRWKESGGECNHRCRRPADCTGKLTTWHGSTMRAQMYCSLIICTSVCLI